MSNIPVCKECSFFDSQEDTCRAVGAPTIDLVRGVKHYPFFAYDERTPGGDCGPTGKHFTQRVIWFGSQRPGEGD